MSFQIQSGNELLIQGGLEAGFDLYTGYPGSPLADFFNILYERKEEFKQKGIKVVIANSEANAAAMASGAKMAGQNTLIAMKSMGLHVAADALSVGNFADPGAKIIDPITQEKKSPGVVVAVGDDPWSISTSTPADSRYLYKHLHIPFLEPATPQELKDWMKHALEISQKSSLYCGILLTTWMAEGGGRVRTGEERCPQHEALTLDPQNFDLSKHVMVPPNTVGADRRMIEERFPLAQRVLNLLNLDRLFGQVQAEIAIVSSGAIFETVKQVLEEVGALHLVCLYKLASPYPLCEERLLPVAKNWKQVIVIEEKRGFLESELQTFFSRHQLMPKFWGKNFEDAPGFPAYGGLNFELIEDGLKRLGAHLPLFKSLAFKELKTPELGLTLPERLPTFCPGCPHRETLSLMKDLRQTLEKRGVKLISHGDVGCYSLSFLAPFKEMHDLSAMGQGGALASGCDIFTENPSLVLMGDSTFFHSGLTAISHSVQLGHNITYIILDNDNTAMTGHQMTPRSGLSVDGGVRPRQDIEQTVRALGVAQTHMVNPSDRYFYQNLLAQLIEQKGTKVIISNKECALTFHGRLKQEERKDFAQGKTQEKKTFYQINTDVCEHCLECVEMTGCPGLSLKSDAYGSKIFIDPQICVNDSYCTKIKACPSFERVEVQNYHPTLYQDSKQMAFTGHSLALPLPHPKRTLSSIAQGEDFRVVVIGVGGSGVTTISRVLAEAAKDLEERADIEFKFVDQKGLAQRNGSVTSHLVFYKKGKAHGQVSPTKMAHLLLSPDSLEGARALKYLAPQGQVIIDHDFQVPLTILLDRGLSKDPLQAEVLISEMKSVFKERLCELPFKELSFQHFHKSVYASAMILGVAFQKGELPFTLEALEQAFTRALPKAELAPNLEAFQWGREWVVKGADSFLASLSQQKKKNNLFELSLSESIPWWKNKERLRQNYRQDLLALKEIAPKIKSEDLEQYLHDLYLFDYGFHSQDFLQKAKSLKENYSASLFPLALSLLAKTYFIKDEVFVSHQLLSPQKKALDQEKYGKLGTAFRTVPINRPEFDFGPFHLRFDLESRPWMLRLMRKARFLRLLLTQWHRKEKHISQVLRQELIKGVGEKRLRELSTVKGYRHIRYAAFELIFPQEKLR